MGIYGIVTNALEKRNGRGVVSVLHCSHMTKRLLSFVVAGFAMACAPLATLAADGSPPVVGAISPATAVAGEGTTVAVPVSDVGAGMSHCIFYVNNVYKGQLPLAGAEAKSAYTFYYPGTYALRVQCYDLASNETIVTSSIAVSPSTKPDNVAPAVSEVTPNSAKPGEPVTFQVTYADNVGVTQCDLYVNGTLKGAMALNNGTASYPYTFANNGIYAVYAACRDAAGNRKDGAEVKVAVDDGNANISPIHSVMYVIPPQILPDGKAVADIFVYVRNGHGMPVKDVPVTVVSSRPGIDSITPVQPITGENGVARFRVTSPFPGESTFTATAAGQALSTSAKLQVNTLGLTIPGGGGLMKLKCPEVVPVNHACTTVYYQSADGKRHAFPNEKMFFSWYGNYSGVVEVSDGLMASIHLGENVTYRPGIRLVKFVTVPKVYAVGPKGELRWITSEAAARSLYGANWSKNVHDLADAFYGDYTFGADIASAADFNPGLAAANTVYIESNLKN
jgi:hypothetical protein